MATLTRSAKSGSQWTQDDLRAFNIQVHQDTLGSFFNLQELPVPRNISPVIWGNVAPPPGVQLSTKENHFFLYLDEAVKATTPGEQSRVDDFVIFLLHMLGYDAGGSRLIQGQRTMSFYMCGGRVDARPDVAVVECDDSGRMGVQCMLFVQDEVANNDTQRATASGRDPEAQLVAEAIAAFHQNNSARQVGGLPPLESQMFPAITIVGTAPTFYKITVTRELLFAVQDGRYPENATIVHRFRPVQNEDDHISTGMVPLENRRIILKCLEAFKQFMVSP